MKEKVFAWIRQHRRVAVAIGGLLVGIALSSAFYLKRHSDVQYFTAEVESGDIQAVVQATGTINAVTTVQVGSQVSGQIAALSADFNSQVKKGQLIAQIDPSVFRTRVLQAEADLSNAQAGIKSLEADLVAAQANVEKARAGLREAELNLKRTLELFEQGIASVQQRDATEVAYETARANLQAVEAQVTQTKARLEQQHAQVKQRQAQLEQARLDLQHTVIKAPIEGTVIARNVDVGQTVAASLQAPTLFTIAQDLTQMLVYAKTDESDVGKIRVGAFATFKVDSFPKETFRGRVTQVRMNAYTVQNVVTYDTIIEFENPEQKLLPGMTAYVTIPIASAREVVRIPNGALRYRPQLSESERRALLAKYNLLNPPQEQRPERPAERAGTGSEAQASERPAPGQGRAASGDDAGRRAGEGSGESERARMRERWQQMSAEERAQMRARFQGMRGQGSQQPLAGPRPDAAAQREGEWQIVWKLTRNNELQPVRVKTGITDYTYTALLEGELKAGEKLVIGQTSRQRPQMPGGLGGVPGMPRRF